RLLIFWRNPRALRVQKGASVMFVASFRWASVLLVLAFLVGGGGAQQDTPKKSTGKPTERQKLEKQAETLTGQLDQAKEGLPKSEEKARGLFVKRFEAAHKQVRTMPGLSAAQR